MSAASALRGWLLCRTSSAAAERSDICQAVTAPNATTSNASTAPMMRRRPGSVVAAARTRSTPSAHAVLRAGAAGSGPCACGGRTCGGTDGIVGAPTVPGGAALPFGGLFTRPPPWSSVRHFRPACGERGRRCTAASIAAGTDIRTAIDWILFGFPREHTTPNAPARTVVRPRS